MAVSQLTNSATGRNLSAFLQNLQVGDLTQQASSLGQVSVSDASGNTQQCVRYLVSNNGSGFAQANCLAEYVYCTSENSSRGTILNWATIPLIDAPPVYAGDVLVRYNLSVGGALTGTGVVSVNNNGTAPNDRKFDWTCSPTTGGGLLAGHLQLFSYGSATPNINQVMDCNPTNQIVKLNADVLDSARVGTINANSTTMVIACASITASSKVVLSISGTSLAGGLPASAFVRPTVSLQPGVSFTLTGTLISVQYDFYILG